MPRKFVEVILHLTSQILTQQMVTHTKTIIQMTTTYTHLTMYPIVTAQTSMLEACTPATIIITK